jgi:exosortase
LFVGACIAGLLAVCYWSAITGMVQQWSTDEDMGHGFVVPFVAVWAAWRGRARWLDRPPRPTWWGLAPVVLAAMLLYLSMIGGGLFLASVAFVIALAGIVLTVGGVPWMKGLAFPLLLLLFMLPKLAFVYNEVTLPLQLLASRLAELALSAVAVHVVRSGNILTLGSVQLSVAEACNGVRYLLSLGFLAVVYGWYFEAPLWMRWALFAASVPVSILANAARVAAAGLCGLVNPAWIEGFFHGFSGWLVFVLSLAALAGINRLLKRMVRHG